MIGAGCCEPKKLEHAVADSNTASNAKLLTPDFTVRVKPKDVALSAVAQTNAIATVTLEPF
jgi:hypothetical protein